MPATAPACSPPRTARPTFPPPTATVPQRFPPTPHCWWSSWQDCTPDRRWCAPLCPSTGVPGLRHCAPRPTTADRCDARLPHRPSACHIPRVAGCLPTPHLPTRYLPATHTHAPHPTPTPLLPCSHPPHLPIYPYTLPTRLPRCIAGLFPRCHPTHHGSPPALPYTCCCRVSWIVPVARTFRRYSCSAVTTCGTIQTFVVRHSYLVYTTHHRLYPLLPFWVLVTQPAGYLRLRLLTGRRRAAAVPHLQLRTCRLFPPAPPLPRLLPHYRPRCPALPPPRLADDDTLPPAAPHPCLCGRVPAVGLPHVPHLPTPTPPDVAVYFTCLP